jgi:hypothetical protein
MVMASTTWYADGNNGSDTNNCLTAANACLTIGHAISLASSGDSIKIAPATYSENLTINISLKLIGTNARSTIIDGGATIRTISILNTKSVVGLSSLTIQDGFASGGAGILNWGILTITNSTITGNVAAGDYSAAGAGIYNSGTLTINNSTLSGNQGTYDQYIFGGAIYNSGKLGLNNTTITGNTVNGYLGGGGGGLYNAGTVSINNSTISGNSTVNQGGGIYNSGTVTIQNSIVANSHGGGNCYGAVTSNGYNLSSDGTCKFANTGDLNKAKSLLGPLANNGGQTQTMTLQTGSPAIDAGNPNGCMNNSGVLLKTDQRGDPRPDKEDTGGCDMGAYERQTD